MCLVQKGDTRGKKEAIKGPAKQMRGTKSQQIKKAPKATQTASPAETTGEGLLVATDGGNQSGATRHQKEAQGHLQREPSV